MKWSDYPLRTRSWGVQSSAIQWAAIFSIRNDETERGKCKQDLKTYLQLSAWGSVTQCKIFPIPYGTTQKIKRFWQLVFQLQEMPRGLLFFLNRNQELTASWPMIRTGRSLGSNPADAQMTLANHFWTDLIHLSCFTCKAKCPKQVFQHWCPQTSSWTVTFSLPSAYLDEHCSSGSIKPIKDEAQKNVTTVRARY